MGIDLCDADTVDFMNFEVLLSPKAAFTFFLRAICASAVLGEALNASIASLLSAAMLRNHQSIAILASACED